ncbi:MAG: MerR family transcriptional regulator [Pseudomonadota bacterium]
MEKAPEAFRTISEVAEDLDVPQHVLRFWEGKFSQVKPMKRAGGRRYYRPNDLELLRGIRHLLYGEGYTIKGVQRILREQGTGYVIEAGKQKALPSQAGDSDEAAAPAAEAPALQQAAPRVPPPAPQARPLEGSDLQVLSGVLKELDAVKNMLTGKNS